MQRLRQLNHSVYRLVAAWLMLALLCVQSTQQHVHLYDHSDHGHHATAHQMAVHHVLAEDNHQHADQLVEVDLASQALAKQLDSDLPIVALFSVLLLVCLLRLASRLSWPRLAAPDRQVLLCPLPPLRGPPNYTL